MYVWKFLSGNSCLKVCLKVCLEVCLNFFCKFISEIMSESMFECLMFVWNYVLKCMSESMSECVLIHVRVYDITLFILLRAQSIFEDMSLGDIRKKALYLCMKNFKIDL